MLFITLYDQSTSITFYQEQWPTFSALQKTHYLKIKNILLSDTS